MKPRHAAALALAGWYLMVPLRPSDLNEPISHWCQVHSFDTAEKCDRVLVWERTDDYAKREKDAGGNSDEIREYQQALQRAKCISADDPRLKGNPYPLSKSTDPTLSRLIPANPTN